MSSAPSSSTLPHEDIVAVDVDGTLAHYTHWQGHKHLGEPVDQMVEKVKQAMAAGRKIVLFSARVYPGDSYQRLVESTESFLQIADWSRKVFGRLLPITFVKTPQMMEFWDDRGRQVVQNTGVFVNELAGKVQ